MPLRCRAGCKRKVRGGGEGIIPKKGELWPSIFQPQKHHLKQQQQVRGDTWSEDEVLRNGGNQTEDDICCNCFGAVLCSAMQMWFHKAQCVRPLLNTLWWGSLQVSLFWSPWWLFYETSFFRWSLSMVTYKFAFTSHHSAVPNPIVLFLSLSHLEFW